MKVRKSMITLLALALLCGVSVLYAAIPRGGSAGSERDAGSAAHADSAGNASGSAENAPPIPAPMPGQRAALLPVVEVGPVVEAIDADLRRYSGRVVSPAVVHVTPRVSGEILEVGFPDGAPVTKGQVLYRLDPVQYEAAVKSIEARIAENQAHLAYAESNYQRILGLYEKDASSRDTLENSRATLEAQRASLLAAEADLISARDNLKNTEIVSPMDGVAGVTAYTAGNYVTPSSGVLVTVIQSHPIRVHFPVATGDFLAMFGSLDALRANGGIRLRLSDGSEYPLAGEFELINNEANPTTDALQIYALFDNPGNRLISGSTVGVDLFRKTGEAVSAVIPSAVMYDNTGTYVYVLSEGNRVEKRYVETGGTAGDLQLVAAGLKVGETVIVKGTHKAVPGAAVEPVYAEI